MFVVSYKPGRTAFNDEAIKDFKQKGCDVIDNDSIDNSQIAKLVIGYLNDGLDITIPENISVQEFESTRLKIIRSLIESQHFNDLIESTLFGLETDEQKGQFYAKIGRKLYVLASEIENQIR